MIAARGIHKNRQSLSTLPTTQLSVRRRPRTSTFVGKKGLILTKNSTRSQNHSLKFPFKSYLSKFKVPLLTGGITALSGLGLITHFWNFNRAIGITISIYCSLVIFLFSFIARNL